jgi:hypothetical protein
MPIKRKAEPPEARKVLHTSLGKRTHYARHVRALRGTAKVADPLPVYALSFKACSRPHPLRYVRLRGWSYLIVGGETTGLAQLRVYDGTLNFAGITDGPAAQLLLDAAMEADSQLRSAKRVFEARILEIPYLRVHALWMYSRRAGSQFVDLDVAAVRGARLESLSDIETRIAAASVYWTRRGYHRKSTSP